MPNLPGIYKSVKRQALNNIIYLANLIALLHWYRHVRILFISRRFPETLFNGLIKNLEDAIETRIKAFKVFCDKLQYSSETYRETYKNNVSALLLHQKSELYEKQNAVEDLFLKCMHDVVNKTAPDLFLAEVKDNIKQEEKQRYIKTIKSLDEKTGKIGTKWLQEIVDHITGQVITILPSLK